MAKIPLNVFVFLLFIKLYFMPVLNVLNVVNFYLKEKNYTKILGVAVHFKILEKHVVVLKENKVTENLKIVNFNGKHQKLEANKGVYLFPFGGNVKNSKVFENYTDQVTVVNNVFNNLLKIVEKNVQVDINAVFQHFGIEIYENIQVLY